MCLRASALHCKHSCRACDVTFCASSMAREYAALAVLCSSIRLSSLTLASLMSRRHAFLAFDVDNRRCDDVTRMFVCACAQLLHSQLVQSLHHCVITPDSQSWHICRFLSPVVGSGATELVRIQFAIWVCCFLASSKTTEASKRYAYYQPVRLSIIQLSITQLSIICMVLIKRHYFSIQSHAATGEVYS